MVEHGARLGVAKLPLVLAVLDVKQAVRVLVKTIVAQIAMAVVRAHAVVHVRLGALVAPAVMVVEGRVQEHALMDVAVDAHHALDVQEHVRVPHVKESARAHAHRVMDAQELAVVLLVKADARVHAHRVMDAQVAPVIVKGNVKDARRVRHALVHVVLHAPDTATTLVHRVQALPW
jgi:hypothetical protein